MTLRITQRRSGRRWLALTAMVAAVTAIAAGTALGANPLNRSLFELDKDATDGIVSVRLGTLGSQVANTTTTSINVCRTATEPAFPFNILIDGERMTVVSGANGSFGGNCAGGVKRTYTVTRPVDTTLRSGHASGENVTWLNPNNASGPDWNAVYAQVAADPETACESLDGVVECSWVHDGRGASIFTQSKDYDEINTGWKWRDQSVPDADELDDGFAVKFDDGSDQNLYFGADRYAANGTKDAGFWFFHGPVAPLPPVGTADGLFTGTHTAPNPGPNGVFCGKPGQTTPDCAPYDADDTGGDVLVLTTFTGGGAVTTIRVYEWIGPAGSTAALLERGSASDCVPGDGTQLLCSTVNNTTIASPWPYSGKGEPQPNAISAGGFMEGGVNLTALGLDGCFSSFMATTRSSASLTADPKDFIFGNFESCTTDITTTPSDSAGDPLEDGDDDDTLPEAQLGTGDAGVSVTDSALLDVKGTTTFSGTLTFYICGPIATGTCDTGGVPAGSETVTADGTYTSDTVNLTEVGRYCWRGEFDIDIAGVEVAVDASEGECFEVLPVTPTLSTTAGADVALGTAVTDTADLGGTANQPGDNGGFDGSYLSINATNGAPAAGTITFTLADAGCEPIAESAQDVNVTGDNDSYGPASYDPGAVGTYHWIASYSGDDPNTNTVSHNTDCSDAAETVNVVDARISIGTSDTNEVTYEHAFTVTVEVLTDSDWVGVEGILVSGTSTGVGSLTTATCTTGPAGTCDLVVDSDVTGVATVHATASVEVVPGVTINLDTAGDTAFTVSNQKTWVDAQIDLDPLTATNKVNDEHTITATVQQDDGNAATDEGDNTDGWAPAPNGTIVTFSLLDNDAGAAFVGGVDTCTITNDLGTCSVAINTSTPGSVDIHATTTFDVSTVSLTRATGTGGNNSADANKVYVDAYIVLSPLTATNEVDDPHTITATVYQDDGIAALDQGDGVDGWAPAPDGTTVDFSLLVNTAGADFTGDPKVDSCETTAGSCSVSINTSSAGSVDIHATTTFVVGGQSLTRATGTGGNNSADANKVYVDAYITIGPDGTNNVGDPHTFTVNVFQDDGRAAADPAGDGVDGFGPAPDGTTVTVALTDSGGAVSVTSEDTCASPGTDAGSCAVTFVSATAGTITGHASVSFAVGGETLDRETDGALPNSDDAVKIYVAGSISWTKVDNAGALQGGATFTVCKTNDYILPDGGIDEDNPLDPAQCFDVVDNVDLVVDDEDVDRDGNAGEFLIEGLSLGRYTVVEKTAPNGFVPDPDTITVDLEPGSADQSIEDAFVNTREVLKITGFGYTNEAVGTPTSGVTHGITTFTVMLHNYGSAVADLTSSSLVVTSDATEGTITCSDDGSLALTGTVGIGADAGPFAITCEYEGVEDGAQIIADLVVKSTTNNTEREASGSPARISFTIQAD